MCFGVPKTLHLRSNGCGGASVVVGSGADYFIYFNAKQCRNRGFSDRSATGEKFSSLKLNKNFSKQIRHSMYNLNISPEHDIARVFFIVYV